MEYVGPSGEKVSGDADLVSRYAEICRKQEDSKQAFIQKMRERGIVACHPDDGWVDREKNRIHFAYPWFNDGATIGSDVVLRRHDNCYRVVRITGLDKGLLDYYRFRVIEKHKAEEQ